MSSQPSHFVFVSFQYSAKFLWVGPDACVLRKGDHISYTTETEISLENVRSIGLDSSKFGLHPLGSEGASQAASCGFGCNMFFIKHGRWKSDDGYFKGKDKIRRSVSLNLGIQLYMNSYIHSVFFFS